MNRKGNTGNLAPDKQGCAGKNLFCTALFLLLFEKNYVRILEDY
jgi:hypothetical protein